jgi:hypothetical protein
MPKIKQRYVEVIQSSSGAQHVMFLPTNMELCRFILSKKVSSTKNAKLVKDVQQAFEVYFKDMIG